MDSTVRTALPDWLHVIVYQYYSAAGKLKLLETSYRNRSKQINHGYSD